MPNSYDIYEGVPDYDPCEECGLQDCVCVEDTRSYKE